MLQSTISASVYFDNAATTPILPSALERLSELNREVMGNSSSVHHRGREAQAILESCQKRLGDLFRVPPSHVIFTSGGTESNNLAIWGALGGLVQAVHWLKNGASGKLITSTTEHSATGNLMESFAAMGASVSWIPVDSEGLIQLDRLETELTSGRTRLVSFHHAQNETGVLQDIRRISELVRKHQPDALFHIDAVQSFLKVPVSFSDLGVDLISVSSHKIGGPKGVGALILGPRFEKRTPKLGRLLTGSEQQGGIRPGTIPVPLIGSFLEAVECGMRNFESNREALLDLRTYLTDHLPKELSVLNGPLDASRASPRRAPQTVSFSVPALPSAVMVEALSARGFCVSAGSACHAASPTPNETLLRMGAGIERALSAIRVSFGVTNTTREIDQLLSALREIVQEHGRK